jgi:hypothetical protein
MRSHSPFELAMPKPTRKHMDQRAQFGRGVIPRTATQESPENRGKLREKILVLLRYRREGHPEQAGREQSPENGFALFAHHTSGHSRSRPATSDLRHSYRASAAGAKEIPRRRQVNPPMVTSPASWRQWPGHFRRVVPATPGRRSCGVRQGDSDSASTTLSATRDTIPQAQRRER